MQKYSKNQINRIITSHKKIVVIKLKKSTCLKWTYGLSVNDYRVALLSNSYLASIGILMQSLKSIGLF